MLRSILFLICVGLLFCAASWGNDIGAGLALVMTGITFRLL